MYTVSIYYFYFILFYFVFYFSIAINVVAVVVGIVVVPRPLCMQPQITFAVRYCTENYRFSYLAVKKFLRKN